MQFEMILKQNSPYTHYCPRPLVAGDVRAYRVVIKTDEILEGAHLLITALRSDGQAVTDIGEMYGGYGEYTLAGNMYCVEGDMRLLITVVDYDGSALTAKEIIFNVVSGYDNDAIDGDDRVPALNTILAKCSTVIEECNSLKDDYGEIVSLYTNLLSPECITHMQTTAAVDITGLEAGKGYSFNFAPYVVMGLNDEGEWEEVNYTITANNCTYIAPEDMSYTTLSIPFDPQLDSSCFMLFEGDFIPAFFKPYGTKAYINDDMLKSVYAELDSVKPTQLETEADAYGAVRLIPNKVHKLTIDKDIYFLLPRTHTYSSLTVQAKVTGEFSIDWGTTHFFKNEIPYIEEGAYDFLFEYDDGWYVGAVKKGQVDV